MHRQKHLQEKRTVSRFLRLYGFLALGIVGAYAVITVFHPGFLAYGLRYLSEALADDIVVTATVLDVPQTPVVSATAVCSSQGVLSVELDWAADPNSYTYDITRDSLPLVNGLTASAYSDTVVSAAMSYTYMVRAHGPMGPGFADSNHVNVTTPNDCEATLPDPVIAVTSFDDKSVTDSDGTPKTTERRPTFTGTTNIAQALIHLTLHSGTPIVANISANSGGYWEWTPPTNISYGQHTLTVTATDPNDAMRQTVTTYVFRAVREEEDEEDNKDEEKIEEKDGQIRELLENLEADLRLSVKEPRSFFQGETIPFSLTVLALDERFRETDLPLRFSLVDSEGESIVSFTREELLRPGRKLEETLVVPLYIKPGQYSIRVEVFLGGINLSRSETIEVKALPLFRLGNQAEITYDEFMQHIGWLVFLSVFFLILWGFLLLWEYALFFTRRRHGRRRRYAPSGLFDAKYMNQETLLFGLEYVIILILLLVLVFTLGVIWRTEKKLDHAYKFFCLAILTWLIARLLALGAFPMPLLTHQDLFVSLLELAGAFFFLLSVLEMRDIVRRLDHEKKR